MTDNSNLVLPTTHHDCKRQVNSLVIYSENNLINFLIIADNNIACKPYYTWVIKIQVGLFDESIKTSC